MNVRWAQLVATSLLLTLGLTGCVGEADDDETTPPATAVAASAVSVTPTLAGEPDTARGVSAVETPLVSGTPDPSGPDGSDPEPSPWRPVNPQPTK